MISVTLVNSSKVPMPKAFLKEWSEACARELRRRKVWPKVKGKLALTVVFLDPPAAKKLNKQYRRKNYATDVLSFSTGEGLGELVLCPQVLQRQAKEHELSFRLEAGYLTLHGILHLLGFDHEQSKAGAHRMYGIQDEVFARLASRIR